MFGGMNFFPEMPRPFNTQYRCYPVSYRLSTLIRF